VKLTFEGRTIRAIFDEMASTLEAYRQVTAKVNGPDPVPEDAVFVDKPVAEKGFTKQMREAKAARAAAKRAAAPVEAPPVEEPVEEPVEKPPLDVNELIKLRQRTITDLQEAYADGRQKVVLDLLFRFGNGAKSFRELTTDAFVPIREAIDAGALK
jgi:hypothetical protein